MQGFPVEPLFKGLVGKGGVIKPIKREDLQLQDDGTQVSFNDAAQEHGDFEESIFMPSADDFERYAFQLEMKAQDEPYNLPDNVFIITRNDMKRIGDDVRQSLENVPTMELFKPLLEEHRYLMQAVKQKGIDAVVDQGVVEDWRVDLVEAHVLAHQAGFVEYAYRQAGYSTDEMTPVELFRRIVNLDKIEPLSEQQTAQFEAKGFSKEEIELANILSSLGGAIKENGLENPAAIEDFLRDDVETFREYVQRKASFVGSAFESLDEFALDTLIGQALFSLENRSPISIQSASGGVLEMSRTDFFAQRTQEDGAVLICADGTQSDADFIKMSFPFDPKKINSDFMHLNYLFDFSNFHEVGHYVMGPREELAEQYGALKYMQQYPDNSGALEMMRDVRDLHFLISDSPETLTTYGQTPKSLSHVLGMKQEDINKLTDETIVMAAREGHVSDEVISKAYKSESDEVVRLPNQGPNKDQIKHSFREISQIKGELALRVAFFEEYQKQEQVLGVEQRSAIAPCYLDANKVSLFISDYWGREDASLEGMSKYMREDKQFLELKASMEKHKRLMSSADLDPEILMKTVDSLLPRYESGSVEHKILSGAELALGNFQDPVKSYGLATNFQVNLERDEPVVHVVKNILSQFEYDGFVDLQRELRNANSDLKPETEDRGQVTTDRVIQDIGSSLFEASPRDPSVNPEATARSKDMSISP